MGTSLFGQFVLHISLPKTRQSGAAAAAATAGCNRHILHGGFNNRSRYPEIVKSIASLVSKHHYIWTNVSITLP